MLEEQKRTNKKTLNKYVKEFFLVHDTSDCSNKICIIFSRFPFGLSGVSVRKTKYFSSETQSSLSNISLPDLLHIVAIVNNSVFDRMTILSGNGTESYTRLIIASETGLDDSRAIINNKRIEFIALVE